MLRCPSPLRCHDFQSLFTFSLIGVPWVQAPSHSSPPPPPHSPNPSAVPSATVATASATVPVTSIHSHQRPASPRLRRPLSWHRRPTRSCILQPSPRGCSAPEKSPPHALAGFGSTAGSLPRVPAGGRPACTVLACCESAAGPSPADWCRPPPPAGPATPSPLVLREIIGDKFATKRRLPKTRLSPVRSVAPPSQHNFPIFNYYSMMSAYYEKQIYTKKKIRWLAKA